MRRTTASTSGPSLSPTGVRTARWTSISASTAAWTRVRRSQRSSGLVTAGPSPVANDLCLLLVGQGTWRRTPTRLLVFPPTRERPTYPDPYAGQHPHVEARAPHPVHPCCAVRPAAQHQLRVLPAARRRR